ncbi:hypothetical protein JCM19047_4442 [Bacillus sp. JCM 19047]|nr:hypothetical protein JCM19047_4442 [Bacillus sp. JCM 19047]
MKKFFCSLSFSLLLAVSVGGVAQGSEEIINFEEQGSYEITDEDLEGLTDYEIDELFEVHEDEFLDNFDNGEDWVEWSEDDEDELLNSIEIVEKDPDVIEPHVLIFSPKNAWELAAVTVVKNRYNHPTTASFIVNSVNKANNITLQNDSSLAKKVRDSTAWKNEVKKQVNQNKNLSGFGRSGSVTLTGGELIQHLIK